MIEHSTRFCDWKRSSKSVPRFHVLCAVKMASHINADAIKYLDDDDEAVFGQLMEVLSDDSSTNDIELRVEAVAFLRRAATKQKCRIFFRQEKFLSWFCDIASKATFWNDGVEFDKFRRFFWQFLFNLSVGCDEFIFDAPIFAGSANVEISFNDVFCSTLQRCSGDKLVEALAGIVHQRLQHMSLVLILLFHPSVRRFITNLRP